MFSKSKQNRSDRTPAAARPLAAAPAVPAQGDALRVAGSIRIRGLLRSTVDVSIHGQVDGTIEAPERQVTIGNQARVEGDVRAGTVLVLGSVEGNITAEQAVEITPSARVRGEVRAPRVSLSEGADFQGTINRGDSATPVLVAPRPVRSEASAPPRAVATATRTNSGCIWTYLETEVSQA